MDKLKVLVSGINTRKSNLNGTKASFDNLTIHNVFDLSESKLTEISTKFSLSNFSLPQTMGYNSLVLYAESSSEEQNYRVAIKILVIEKNSVDTLDSIHKMVSDNGISPKIFFDCNIDFNSRNYVIKLIMSERVIPFDDFEWTSIIQMKKSILTLIDKTLLLHSMDYVHSDLKYENMGLNDEGEIYIFDYDNFTEISNSSCSKIYSSSVCHPPDNLISSSISHGLGNRIIDLFSIVTIILGDIIDINCWHFDNEQLSEKRFQITHFKRCNTHKMIQKIIDRKFSESCSTPFWYSLINFAHIVFQKNNKIINKHAFIRRSKKLIKRMKSDL
jgi:hypothetical protein